MESFCPGSKTVNVDVGAASGNVQVTTGRGKTQVRIMNNGSATAWIALGETSAVVATLASGMPVGPGVTEVITVGDVPALWIAAIAAGSTGKIHFTPGAGI